LVHEVGSAPKIFERAIATLKPDRVALEKAAKEEFISAVDLADYLASTRKVEFRKLYHVIGKAVGEDRAGGNFDLQTLNAVLLEAGIRPPLTTTELKEVTDPKLAVNRRKSLGGPALKDVREQAAELTRLASECARQVSQHEKQVEKSKNKLQEAIVAPRKNA